MSADIDIQDFNLNDNFILFIFLLHMLLVTGTDEFRRNRPKRVQKID